MAALMVLYRRIAGERGQTLVEYALILALVALALVASVGLLGSGLDTIVRDVADAIP